MGFQGSLRRLSGRTQRRVAALCAVGGLLTVSASALAVPSFAEQTGMPCSQCHTVAYGPALTAYGREFKLNGYVFGDAAHFIPFALMAQGGYTRTSADLPDAPAAHTSVNGNFSVDQVSLFYAGRMSEHSGAFVQTTYSGPDRHFSWDNLDIRYARSFAVGSTGVVAGVTINNNPTVQDLWNSTPAWGFPYIGSALAPGPTAAPLITGVGQSVIGASAYAMVDGHWYLEAGGYKGLSDRWLSNVGLYADSNIHTQGLAPYWRFAYQGGNREQQWSVGTFGMRTELQPDPTVPQTDRYTDVGFDATYQFSNEGPHAFAANLSLIHEHANLDGTFALEGADSASQHLRTLNLDLTYAYERTWVGSVQFFNTTGSSDATLYGPDPVDGSNNGSPDSSGYTLQLEWVPFGKQDSFARPWLNLRLGLQYVGYSKFNGGTSNYDGFGRSAHDNNTLFAYFWIIG